MPPLDGVERYQDLTITPDGTVIGVADRDRLFAFEPASKAVRREIELEEETANQQGPDNFVWTDDGRLFLLFHSGRIAQVDLETYAPETRARAPAVIRNGAAYRDGRIYFATESNVYSWAVPDAGS